jgi:hypothetical protein
MYTHIFDRLVWHTPSLDTFQREGVTRALTETHTFDSPLMVLLAARWFESLKHAEQRYIVPVENVGSIKNSVVVISDYAASSRDVWWQSIDEVREKGNLVVKFSCVGDTEGLSLRGALNAFDYSRYKRVSSDGFYDLGTQNTHEDPDIITVPMGCGQSWLPDPITDRGRVILLDEVHSSVIENFEDENCFNVHAYRHSLEVCSALSKIGYRILTFCRESRKFIEKIKTQYPFLETIDWDGWMPFTEIAKQYARAPLFFSHFHEAHGYPIYENLQLGNAVVGYAENINPHVVRPFQNGVLLSVSMQPSTAATMVDDYHHRYLAEDLRPIIARDAHVRFSCDTFVSRLVSALQRKGVFFETT